MMSSLSRWLGRHPRTIMERAAGRKKTPCKLHVEVLEDRTVPSTIQGTVFNDANSSGVFDSGDSGLAGWTVFLDGNRNAIVDSGESVSITDAAGHYLIDTTNSGQTTDIVGLVLQAGSGGSDRWVNTTGTYQYARQSIEPDATRDFGVHLQPFQPIGVQPAGAESLVNQTTAGQQGIGPAAGSTYYGQISTSADAAGNYVVAWRTVVPGGTDTISARVFNADGSARTNEITVGTFANSPNLVAMPSVAMAGNGSRFMVAWQTRNDALSASSVYARVYQASNGQAVSSQITVIAASSKTSGAMPAVAADTAGDFVLNYRDLSSKYAASGSLAMMAQRYTSSGSANGNPIKVAVFGFASGDNSVAMDGAGNFVVVWDDLPGITMQRFQANGTKVGSTAVVMPGIYSNVAMNATGQFVVTGGGLAKRFNADGTAWGSTVAIAAPTGNGRQTGTSIDSAGNVTLAWTDTRPPSGTSTFLYALGEVRMQRLTAAGTLTPETIVNTTTQGAQFNPGVAATGNGTFVVAWQGYGPGDDAGIFSQRYGLTPTISSFTASPNPVTAGSPVTLTAAGVQAFGPGSTITQVAFYLDSNGDGKLDPSTDTLLGYGSQTSTGTWTFTFTVNLTPGSYKLFAQAKDSYGVLSDPLALDLQVL